MDYTQVKELIAIIDRSTLTEFDLSMDNVSLRMSKNAGTTVFQKNDGENLHQNPPGMTAVTEPMTFLPEDAPVPPMAGEIIKSPIVGVFYESPGPDKPPFKKQGDKVAIGDTVCIIEAMKVMNEITSKFEGTLAEIMVENESQVEFGQPLFRIV